MSARLVPLRALSAAPVTEVTDALSPAQTRAVRLLARGASARVGPSVLRNLERQGIARGDKLTTRGTAVAAALTGARPVVVDPLADAMRRAFAHNLTICAAEITSDDDVVLDTVRRVVYVSHLLPAEHYADAVLGGIEAWEDHLAEQTVTA